MRKESSREEGRRTGGWRLVDDAFLRCPPEWFAASVYVVAIILALLILALVLFGLWLAFKVAADSTASDFRERMEAAKVFFPIVLALVGGPFLIWRVITAHISASAASEQAAIGRETHFTTLFTKAVEQLGATRQVTESIEVERDGKATRETDTKTEPNLEVRIGAIYALERIAQDSERDHWPIMEVLCAYVRNKQNCGSPKLLSGITDAKKEGIAIKPPRLDVQAALSVIGRRSKARIVYERAKKYSLDLSGANLQRANLKGADFSGANFAGSAFDFTDFRRANFEKASFVESSLIWVSFARANLNEASFTDCQIGGAVFTKANLKRSNLSYNNIRSSTFSGAQLQGASFQYSTLSRVGFNGAFLNNASFLDAQFDWISKSTVRFKAADFGDQNRNARRFSGVALFDCDLAQCKGLTDSELEEAYGDGSTKLPESSRRPAFWPTEELNYFERSIWMKAGVKRWNTLQMNPLSPDEVARPAKSSDS